MECPYCKTENRAGVRYCASCGKLLNDTLHTPSQSRTLTSGARLQGGRYVVKRVLGQGGMGAAVLATDIRLASKSVVIKELISEHSDTDGQQDDVRNFKREVSLLAHIDHPLIPTVTDHFQEDARYFMVQEYIEGENLEERLLHQGQPLKEREALLYASETLDILEYLSQQNPPIVHRDIKPSNIIISERDRHAHLVDFGIARKNVARTAQRPQTVALGTPGYAPPEQYQGNADPRSDLYALAATLHHVLTNRDPRNHPPFTYPPVRTLNPQLSPETEQVLARGLLNDMQQRYQSATALKQDIDSILRQRFGVSGSLNAHVPGGSGPTSMSGFSSAQNTSATGPNMTSVTSPIAQTGRSEGVAPIPTQTYAQTPAQLHYGQQGYAPDQNYVNGRRPSFAPPAKMRRRTPFWLIVLLLFLLLLVVTGGILAATGQIRIPSLTVATPTATAKHSAIPDPVKVGNDYIGISAGTIAFDTTRLNAASKQEAAQHLQQDPNDIGTAESLLRQAILQDTSDAESLIYLEDLRVLNSGKPYVTLVVATTLQGTGAMLSVAHGNLQGAYVAQKEFNDGSKLRGGVQIRLLIADSGQERKNAPLVAQQIVELAKADKTVVGVLGWPFSEHTHDVLRYFSAAHLPLLSPTAADDGLSASSPYFLRVAPSNKMEAIEGARYAKETLKAKAAALFVDPKNPYSQSLAAEFEIAFKKGGGQVFREEYTVDKGETIPERVQDALTHKPDMIYFAGYAHDVSTLLINLPAGKLPVLGGDALYELGGYASSSRAAFDHLSFTAFAYPDQWEVLGHADKKPAFFAEYATAFDPNDEHKSSGNPYGFRRADSDTILSYDGMVALLKGYNNALVAGKQQPTPEDLVQGLRQIAGERGFQGVSGYIAFDDKGDPQNKAIIILYVDAQGFFKMRPQVFGRFLQ